MTELKMKFRKGCVKQFIAMAMAICMSITVFPAGVSAANVSDESASEKDASLKDISVKDITVKSITVTPKEVEALEIGEETELSAEVIIDIAGEITGEDDEKTDITKKDVSAEDVSLEEGMLIVTWGSEDSSTASVTCDSDNDTKAVVKAVEEGTTYIHVTAKDAEKRTEKSASVQVKVVKKSVDDPTEKDPTDKDPTEKDPTDKDPKPEDPTEKDPTDKDPKPEDPTDKDPKPEDPTDKDPKPEDPTDKDPKPEDPTDKEPTVPIEVTGIKLDKNVLVFDTIGAEQLLTATVDPADADDKTVTWTTNNDKVATVTNGKVKAVGNGTAVITAKAGNQIATATVTVSQKTETLSITLNGQQVKGTLPAQLKKKYSLQAVVTPENTDGKNAVVTWSSSNKKIASVDKNGKVTVKKKGKVTITAKTADGKTATVKFKADNKVVKVKKLTIAGKKTMAIKSKQKLGVIVNPATAGNQKVTWKSSNKKVATVNKKGVVKAKKKGTVKITATAKDGSNKKVVFRIRVK